MDDRSGYSKGIRLTDLEEKRNLRGIIVIPERIDAVNGTGYYSESASTTYKELLSLGYDVQYYTDKKSGIHRNGAIPEEIVSFMIGIAGNLLANGVWEGARALIKLKANKKSNPKIQGNIYINSRSEKHNTWIDYTVEGSVDDAIKMIDKIQELHSGNTSTRKKEDK